MIAKIIQIKYSEHIMDGKERVWIKKSGRALYKTKDRGTATGSITRKAAALAVWIRGRSGLGSLRPSAFDERTILTLIRAHL